MLCLIGFSVIFIGKTCLTRVLHLEVSDLRKQGIVFWVTARANWDSHSAMLSDFIGEKEVYLQKDYPQLDVLFKPILETVKKHKDCAQDNSLSFIIVVDDLMTDVEVGSSCQERRVVKGSYKLYVLTQANDKKSARLVSVH